MADVVDRLAVRGNDMTYNGNADTSEVPRARWGQRARSLLGVGLRSLSDVIVPPVCLACHAPLSVHDALCAPCWGTIDFIGAPLCNRLGMPLNFDTGRTMVSAAAGANPPDYHRARAVAAYSGTIQKLIHGFKYSDRHDARRLFGRWLTSAGEGLIADCDIVVPIPLNRWRLLHRRFNQSAILSLEVSRLSGVGVALMGLERHKPTASQVGLTTAERSANMSNAFRVPAAQRAVISGRRILMIDDVITTGATSNAAARALLKAGAAQVDVLALAMVTHTVS